MRRGTAVWLDASSRHGVVRNELSADAGPADGEDTLELHARTGYGDITVHRVTPEPPPAPDAARHRRRVARLAGLSANPGSEKERR